MFLYILLALAVLFILAQTWLLWVYIKRIDVLGKAYDSLDQGMTEITDAYESDSLQYEETIEHLNDEKAQFEKNNAILMQNAKIDRLARHEQDRTINQLRHEIAGVRRQLDIAQVIISEHDLNCLPHIVLSHMENQQDTPLPL